MDDDREFERSDEELKDFRLDYLKRCERKEYRRLLKAGELEAHLQKRADSCRSFAAALIGNGEFPGQAWHWAIRVRLLDTEMD